MRIFKLNTSNTKRALSALSVLFISLVNLSAQNNEVPKDSLVTISGIIRDAKTRKPIPIAQIRSVNWEAATTSNDSGLFKIKVASLSDVLSISAFDYGIREVAVRGKDSITVDLYHDFFTSPYKMVENLTGPLNNSSTVQGLNSVDNITASPFLSIDNEIQSQLGGNIRAITRSGIAGMGASLFIRGLNSVNANAQPLFIVDGAIWDNSYDENSLHSGFYSNPLAAIDVADIENITVIKDGVSLYGSKGSNGVIIINTNRPKGEVTKIRANLFWGVTTRPASMPLMDGSQFRIYASDILKGSIAAGETVNENFLDDNPSKTYYNKYHNATNWDDQIYRTGLTQSYLLSVNGGDEKALYVFSVGYTNDKGVVKNTDMQRLNARFKASINFTNKFNTLWNIGYTNLDRTLLDDGVNYLTSPSFLSMIKAPFLSPHQYTVNGYPTADFEDADDFGVGNPAAIIENSHNNNKQYRFNIGVTPEYRFSPNLSIRDNFDYSLYNVRENFYRPKIGGATVTYTNPAMVSENEIKNQESRNVTLNNDAQFIFNKKYNGYHLLKAILGWRYIKNDYELDYGEGHNTANDRYLSLEDATFKFTQGANNRYKSVSTYANIDYSFKNRYLFNAVFDMDASSRFGQETQGGLAFLGKKWGMFPAINGAWVISSEQFMRQIDFVNRLKLRAGYGITGNDDVGYYTSVPYLVSKNYSDKAVGLILGNIANDHIQWETTSRANVGIDLSVANERITLSGDFYNSTTKNLLMLKSYPDITGLDSYWHNSGELSNVGYEAMVNVKVLNLKSLKWELGVSAGHYKNKITTLPDGDFTTSIFGGEILTAVGKPAGVFFGYKTQGVFATQTDADNAGLYMIDKDGNMQSFGAGDVYFQDVNGDNIIDTKDKQVIGNPNPEVYGSVISAMSFKNFTFDALFTYSYGNKVYNYLRSQLESGSNLYNQSTVMLNRWRTEGQQTLQPKAEYGDPMGNARFSDRWIEDGSFFKLKALTITYKVPIKVSFIEGINVWVSANNLFTLTNYLGRDPEFSANNSVLYQGIDLGLMPNTRSYFVGIKLNL
jgi:TonB-linked SusC/RagA family outer membrane protein